MSNEIEHYGFGGFAPVPAEIDAIKFSEKVRNMMLCWDALELAKIAVPDYTGQWEPSDYYAEKEEKYNRSADDLWNFVKENIND